jgi:hypothetical protein
LETVRRWEDDDKMDVMEVGWKNVYWILLSQERVHWRALVNTAVNLKAPSNARNFLIS